MIALLCKGHVLIEDVPGVGKTTLASALAKMNGQYSQKYPELMMAALISCVPMIILYIIFQKQFIEGIATSGGKL